MNYPTCRTCKHFEPSDRGVTVLENGLMVSCDGFCRRIDGGSHAYKAWLEGSDHDADTLFVSLSFGCNLHEPLTEEKEG